MPTAVAIAAPRLVAKCHKQTLSKNALKLRDRSMKIEHGPDRFCRCAAKRRYRRHRMGDRGPCSGSRRPSQAAVGTHAKIGNVLLCIRDSPSRAFDPIFDIDRKPKQIAQAECRPHWSQCHAAFRAGHAVSLRILENVS